MNKKRLIILMVFLIIVIGILLCIYLIDFNTFPFDMKLNGESITKININDEYKDEGVKAKLLWMDVSDEVKVTSNINSDVPGNYTVKYSYKKSFINKELEREVIVIDNIPPELNLAKEKVTIYTDGTIKVGKITATDNIDGDLTKSVVYDKNISTKKAGKYKIDVSVKDSSGNETVKSITVIVKDKPVYNGSNNARIDVFISEQKLYYYENNKLILTSDVVTGIKNGTPTGHYKVLSKKADVWLQGSDFLDHVDYWIAFIGRLYGIHDASWRDKFGGNIYIKDGSHGCVNMPTDNMEKLYKRVEIGTAVNIYD